MATITKDDIYSNKIFLNAVLPLIKVISEDDASMGKKFAKTHAVVQIGAKYDEAPEGKVATHFVINSGEWEVHPDSIDQDPHVELLFKDIPSMNAFFKGDIGLATFPKLRVKSPKYVSTLVSTFMLLLKMSSLLTATEIPDDEATQKLISKCYFYLIMNGISQLNKAGHEDIKDWTTRSPDRIFAMRVDGYPDVASYIRVKAGKSRAGRGIYKRSLPFLEMRFATFADALGIMFGSADMIDSIKSGALLVDGAPEFAGQIGNYMFLVADYAKG